MPSVSSYLYKKVGLGSNYGKKKLRQWASKRILMYHKGSKEINAKYVEHLTKILTRLLIWHNTCL